MKFIIGKKLNMTQIWQKDKVVAVTKIQSGPCVVTQVKTIDNDGYESAQIGYAEKKEKNIKKPQKGHLNKLKNKNKEAKTNLRYLREFCLSDSENNLNIGDVIDIGTFVAGDIVDAVGVSKGKGFQGVVKRHGFKGTKKTHGNKDQLRMPGSIGATGPAHVFKGTRMGGRMGGKQATSKNLEIMGVDKENNILLVKGAVPGARNGLILISGKGELKILKISEEKNNERKISESEKLNKTKKISEDVEKVVIEADEKRKEKIN